MNYLELGLQMLNTAFVGGIFMYIGGFRVDINEMKRRLRNLERKSEI